MAKKSKARKVTATSRKVGRHHKYLFLGIPAASGALAWILSASLGLGVIIFVAILAGNWVASKNKH